MNPPSGISFRTLLLLSLCVLLVHLVLLRGFSAVSISRSNSTTPAFQTRLISAADSAAPPVVPPPVKTRSANTSRAVSTTEPAADSTANRASSPPAGFAQLAVPPSRRLRYEVNGQARGAAYTSVGELRWQHDDSGYSARSFFVSPVGSREQTSVGTLSKEGLAPSRFGDKLRSEVAAHFERDKGIIIFSANTPDKTLLPGAQDFLSTYIQLASLVAGHPARFTKGSMIELQVVGPRDAEVWQFEVEGEESLRLGSGEIPTLKLFRMAQKSFDVTVELWLAPTLDYLPARIRLTQSNGDFSDQKLQSSETP